ncbi:MAG: nucleotidyltransferase family protein [Chitinophagales bacterium]
MKAMIFAAGLGTRLRPLTNHKPKALVEVNGTPLLEIVIQRLKQQGFNNIVVNVHYFAKQIIRFLEAKNNFGIQISISDETDLLLETGGGLLKTRSFFEETKNEPFLVHNVDILSDIDLAALYQSHLQNNPLATLVVRNRKTSRYLLFDEANQMYGWKNVKTGEVRVMREISASLPPKALAFSGIHVISPTIFQYMPKEENAFSIIETYLQAAKTQKIMAYPSDNSNWLDVGKPESLAQAEELIKKF